LPSKATDYRKGIIPDGIVIAMYGYATNQTEQTDMIKNYLLIALRHFQRNRAYSFINVFGFAIGLMTCLLIFFYLQDELTFDRFHQDSKHIYRLLTQGDSQNDQNRLYAITAGPLLRAAKAELPEVVNSVEMMMWGRSMLRADASDDSSKKIVELRAHVCEATPALFEMFNFKLLEGDPKKALVDPNGFLLTPKTATTLFGSENPIGKTLIFDHLPDAHVSGIVDAPPQNSHLQFDALRTYISTGDNAVWRDSWENIAVTGYVKLAEGSDPLEVERKIGKIAKANNFASVFVPRLQPLHDIHLRSTDLIYDDMNFHKNDSSRVRVLVMIGVMILIIASINFINLSSARSAKRAREVGMRKVVGANRGQLIAQFLGESVILTLGSMIIAMSLTEILLPILAKFVYKDLECSFLSNPGLTLIFLAISAFVGVLAGIYPTILITKFKPIQVLRGNFQLGREGLLLRRTLVVTQFVAPIILIAAVIVVNNQIQYLQTVDLGYNRKDVVVLRVNDKQVVAKKQSLMSELKNLASVAAVGSQFNLPGTGEDIMRMEIFTDNMRDQQKGIMCQTLMIDDGVIDALELNLIEGRNFSGNTPSDTLGRVIVNEQVVQIAGWESAIDKEINYVDVDGKRKPSRVIGVIENMHFGTARQDIEPMIMAHGDKSSPLITIRAVPEIGAANALVDVKRVWKKMFPDVEISEFFLDDAFNTQFIEDKRFAEIVGVFSLLAIAIASLGLFGLVSFATEQKRHEIAVRKVIGAGEGQIIGMLTGDFMKWVALANLIAIPLGYFAMQIWLSEFIYKMPFTLLPFVWSGVGSLLIAMITLSGQSFQAARTNPAISLRQDA